MYTHLKERQFYEDIYDRHTVEEARRGMVHYYKFHDDVEKRLDKGDTIDRPGNAAILNAFYMQVVGLELLRRYENRELYIADWMAKDEAKDAQIAAAQLTEEPYCQHCGKQGLRIIDKSLMHRTENAKYDDPEEVLFMLRCTYCDKNSAFWEDGMAWKVEPERCPKCRTEVTHKTTKTKTALTLTYTCPSCGHSYKDKMDLRKKEEKSDPDFDKDRIHYCLVDKEFRDKLYAIKDGFERMAELGKQFKEREDNKHVYDAIKEMKKPKIAELSTILAPALEKAGYIEFSLDKPEIGKDVIVGFNCLDSKSERGDYDSEKILKKTVVKALEDTNWRLMSDGIHYRLGYLSGRLRAYEREEDMKDLVERTKQTQKRQKPNKAAAALSKSFKTPDGKEIIL
jgi:predicted RNA-binding Zn-ribbon protein involved in translation (DUF1610 family)